MPYSLPSLALWTFASLATITVGCKLLTVGYSLEAGGVEPPSEEANG